MQCLTNWLYKFSEGTIVNVQKDIDLLLNPIVFGERAIRMVNGKINIYGGFRTMDGLNWFAKIRSFIMTSKYREENVLSNLVTLLSGEEYKLT